MTGDAMALSACMADSQSDASTRPGGGQRSSHAMLDLGATTTRPCDRESTGPTRLPTGMDGRDGTSSRQTASRSLSPSPSSSSSSSSTAETATSSAGTEGDEDGALSVLTVVSEAVSMDLIGEGGGTSSSCLCSSSSSSKAEGRAGEAMVALARSLSKAGAVSPLAEEGERSSVVGLEGGLSEGTGDVMTVSTVVRLGWSRGEAEVVVGAASALSPSVPRSVAGLASQAACHQRKGRGRSTHTHGRTQASAGSEGAPKRRDG